MSLLESQTFFYNLCAKPETIKAFKENPSKTLKKYFSNPRDREYLIQYAPERFQTYRNHISYGILGGIASCFPVLKSLISEKEWNDLLNNFYLKRLTKSPIARHVFGEFSYYLQKKYRGPLLKKFPYLRELAEYEYLDLKLFFEKEFSHEEKLKGILNLPKNPKSLLKLKPLLNPHLEARLYHWPVHLICKNYSTPAKVKKGSYGLVIYRDPETLKVRFVEANETMLKLILFILNNKNISELIKKFSPDVFQALGFLKEKNIILGYK
ncbi:MAG: putative DNA-binding domain-containing protein [Deltaproteobacteria bacterium]|nr:MAG: putative DNA-binding domain-containing protein [Deltaproteobacteria bacterium]